jgi:hypothetical protein
MGDYVHRTTKQYLQSVSPNDLPEPLANYIEDPDLSSVVGVPNIYWIITGDVITEMSQGQKDTVDAALLFDSRNTAIEADIDNLESVMRQLTQLTLREINILRQQFNTTTAESNQLTDTALADRTMAQAKAQMRSDLGS